jgi:hypothetical protein
MDPYRPVRTGTYWHAGWHASPLNDGGRARTRPHITTSPNRSSTTGRVHASEKGGDPMQRIALDSTQYYGNTSRPAARLEFTRTECLKCGTSLAGRSEGLRRWGDKLVRVFACPCGRRRRVEVPAR